MILFSLCLHGTILDLPAPKLALVALAEEDHAVGVGDGGEDHLLALLVLDDGHPQGVVHLLQYWPKDSGLLDGDRYLLRIRYLTPTCHDVANVVTIATVNLHIEVVGLQTL